MAEGEDFPWELLRQAPQLEGLLRQAPQLEGLLRQAPQLEGLLRQAALRVPKWLFQSTPGDIQPCTTRIARDNRGLPWDKQIAIHPLPDGTVEMKALRPDPS